MVLIYTAVGKLGLKSVAIYSQADRLAAHRYKADYSFIVGSGDTPVGVYLNIESIVGLAKQHNVDAIHPGYGFLSENANLARRCAEEGIMFIGPLPETSPEVKCQERNFSRSKMSRKKEEDAKATR